MKSINFKREISGTVDQVIEKITKALQGEGFGILTRIDFHQKMKEKLGKDLPPTVILGACNPHLAYEAYVVNTDITSLVPCNVVVREVAPQMVSIEIVKPTIMMEALGEQGLVKLAQAADDKLKGLLDRL